MFLVNSAKYANDPDGTAGAIMAILERAGATVVASRPWQDGKLAYEVSGHRKGLHFLVCFRMPGAGMEVVKRQCHLSDVIIRHLVIKHTPQLFNAMVDALTGESSAAEAAAEAKEAPADAKPAAAEAAAE
ncbi:MAG: 30S ribosomal protein S6 [Fuerstiella sp.]|nr:30S ribosomal protein S6 [Fuerstiella sp.]MCP4857107.1 30S ribosomal protein S6 [Fuerstiella sp.]